MARLTPVFFAQAMTLDHRPIDAASERGQPRIDPGECVADELPTGGQRRSGDQSATANQKRPPVDPIHVAILRTPHQCQNSQNGCRSPWPR